jgi:hypothetical protein
LFQGAKGKDHGTDFHAIVGGEFFTTMDLLLMIT